MVATDSSNQPLALQETVDDLTAQLESVTSDRDFYKSQYGKQSTDLYEARCALRALAKTVAAG